VWFDEWDITAGVRLTQTLQDGLAASRAVVLVVSAAAIGKEWWQEEFNAAMAAVIGGSQREWTAGARGVRHEASMA